MIARRLCGLVLALTFMGALMPHAALSRTGYCDVRDQIADIGKGWLAIRPPGTESHFSSKITDYAVSPYISERVYVTDGDEVMRSSDEGCHWESVFSLDPDLEEFSGRLGWTRETATIDSIVIPDSISAPSTLYLTISGDDETAAGIPGLTISPKIVISRDGGRTWSAADSGLPPSGEIRAMAVSASDPRVVYSIVEQPISAAPVAGPALFRSEDGAETWDQVNTALGNPFLRVNNLLVDPIDTKELWAWGGGGGALHSLDGGQTFRGIVSQSAVTALDVFHPAGSEPTVMVFAGQQGFRTEDRGKSFTASVLPETVTSVRFGGSADEVMATTTSSHERAVYAYNARDEDWTPLASPSFPVVGSVSRDEATPQNFYALGEDQRLFKYTRGFGWLMKNPLEPRSLSRIGEGAEGCPPPAPPAPWRDGWQEAPSTHDGIYVTNFDTGYVVRFDAHGTGTIVGQAPAYSEGITLDPLGRVIITTRFSDILARLDPLNCRLTTLNYDAFSVEGPTFDHRTQSLFVVNNSNNYVYEYSWPQIPRQKPKLVWRMPGFVEDLKVAPSSSPFAGELFVLYRDRATDIDDSRACNVTDQTCISGQPNAIRILYFDEQKQEWFREKQDFANFGPSDSNDTRGCNGFQSAGMAFLPDGRLLVSDICGSGEIRAYYPDGSGYDVFAQIASAGDIAGPALVKIDVTHDGYVYVTAVQRNGVTEGMNGKSALVRLDPEGRRMLPDFTQNLTWAVGVAVPQTPFTPLAPPTPNQVTTKKPKQVPDRTPVERETIPLRAVPIAPVPPAPPPPPATGSAPAPISEPAPAQAPNPQSAPHPAVAVAAQPQQQPQVALVHAAQSLREQLGEQYAMSSVRGRAEPLEAVKYGLGIAALTMILAYGIAYSTARRLVIQRGSGYR